MEDADAAQRMCRVARGGSGRWVECRIEVAGWSHGTRKRRVRIDGDDRLGVGSVMNIREATAVTSQAAKLCLASTSRRKMASAWSVIAF